MLPCSHVFCHECISNLLDAELKNTIARTILCPICRTHVESIRKLSPLFGDHCKKRDQLPPSEINENHPSMAPSLSLASQSQSQTTLGAFSAAAATAATTITISFLNFVKIIFLLIAAIVSMIVSKLLKIVVIVSSLVLLLAAFKGFFKMIK